MSEGLAKAQYVHIRSLHPEVGGVNLVVQVVSNALAVDKPRVDGSRVRIAEVTVADETGCIILRARNEQIEQLPAGRVVVLRNATIEMFRRTMRLVVTKWGKISPHPDGVASTPAAPRATAMQPAMSEAPFELTTSAAATGGRACGGGQRRGGHGSWQHARQQAHHQQTPPLPPSQGQAPMA